MAKNEATTKAGVLGTLRDAQRASGRNGRLSNMIRSNLAESRISAGQVRAGSRGAVSDHVVFSALTRAAQAQPQVS